MVQVHPMFKPSLFGWYTGDRMLPTPLEVDNKIEYIVNKIVWHRGRPRQCYYLVRWAGYNESKDMWLPESEIGNVPDVPN